MSEGSTVPGTFFVQSRDHPFVGMLICKKPLMEVM